MRTGKEILHAVWRNLYWYWTLRPKKRTAYLMVMPTHENIGDAAIAVAMKRMLSRCGYSRLVEITARQYWEEQGCIRRAMPKNATLFLEGGGSIGDVYQSTDANRRAVLTDFPSHRIVIFPQTIFYQDKSAMEASIPFYNRANLVVAARETTSQDIMQSLYPNATVILVPDIVLSMVNPCTQKARSGITVCFRKDQECALPESERLSLLEALRTQGYSVRFTDMLHSQPILPPEREKVMQDKMEEFAVSRLVITDRLHAMIFCAITATPCITFGNNHHKVQGVYQWIRHLPYIRFACTAEEALALIPQLSIPENPYTPLEDAFLPLIQEITQKGDAKNG